MTYAIQVRRPFGDIEIALHPPSIEADVLEASVRELKHLVFDFKSRQREARHAVHELRSKLLGWRSAEGVDSRVSRDAVGEELLRAARAGIIVARRREVRTVVVPLDGPAEEVLGPNPDEDTSSAPASWVGVTLVDQTGTPVPNRPYRIIKPDGTTVDGTLDSNGAALVMGLDPGNCQIWCPYVEPHPSLAYAVQDGDHLSGVAQTYGFDDYTVVWNDPGNADLQSQRSDPHVLLPGDALTIPEVTAQPAANKPTGAKHPFTIQQSPLKLRLTLLDLSCKAVASAPVTVAETALTTDGNGLAEATIDKGATTATLSSSGPDVSLQVGGLNPVDDETDAGYKARLVNLGFLWDPTAADTDDEMLIALQDFQAQYSLPLSGQLDDATKAQLLQTYGC